MTNWLTTNIPITVPRYVFLLIAIWAICSAISAIGTLIT